MTDVEVTKHINRHSHGSHPNVELVCYRVAQEALTNVARHSGADKVWLDLHARPEHARPTDYRQWQRWRRHEGAGIKGMRERALLVDAPLVVDSPPGEGTKVGLDVPLRQEYEPL